MLLSAESPAGVTVMGVMERWACQNCTYDNEYTHRKCDICGDDRPIMPSSTRMLPGQCAPFKITATVAAGDSDVSELEDNFYTTAMEDGWEGGSNKNKKSKKSKKSTTTTTTTTTNNNASSRAATTTTTLTSNKRKRGRPKKNPSTTKVAKVAKAAKKAKTAKGVKGNTTKGKKKTAVRKHRKGGIHSCQYCGKTFRYTTNWRSHERTHTGEKIYICKWAGCTKKFSHLSSLQAHTSKHKGIKPCQCKEPGCTQTFANKSNLNR